MSFGSYISNAGRLAPHIPHLTPLTFTVLLLLSLPVFAEDWPEFRGPTGQGISTEHGLPLTWSETRNVKWKVAIPGRGWSSPAILGDRIWLTTATEEGKSLRAICVDRNSGAIQHNIEVFRLKQGALKNGKNSQASPTPVLEGDRVYLHFGAHGGCMYHSVRRSRLEDAARIR